MTEAEYIQTIRTAAEGYLGVLRDPDALDRDHDEAMRRVEHWAAIKVNLSPNTMIDLCDLWLENNGAEASQDGHETRQRQEEEKSEAE